MPIDATRVRALLDAIDQHAGPFEWGTRDCVTFAAAVVRGIRGTKIATTWRSETEANAEIVSRGGLVRAVSSVLGRPYRVTRGTPRDGDIVLSSINGFAMLSAWVRDKPIGMTAHGVTSLRRDCARLGWRV